MTIGHQSWVVDAAVGSALMLALFVLLEFSRAVLP
jgi:hypothetical protein